MKHATDNRLPEGLELAEDVAPEDTAAPVDPTLCPRCGNKLANPEGLGWCSKCGYCRSIEEEAANPAMAAGEASAAKKPSALGAAEFAETMRLLPPWSRPLLAGVFVIILACVVGNGLLAEEGLARCGWATAQLLVSFAGLVLAQLWVIVLVGDTQDSLGPKDVFLPGRVWRAAVRGLPKTRQPVWLGAWSVTALVCSVALLGGFGTWFEVLRQTTEAKKLRDAAALADADKKEDKDAGSSGADAGDAGKAAGRKATPATVQCVVIGYQADSGGGLIGVVVATTNGDKLTYGGVVTSGLTARTSKDLMNKLSRLRRNEPLIPGLKLKGTFWVRPGVFCDVAHTGTGADGELQDAKLKGLTD